MITHITEKSVSNLQDLDEKKLGSSKKKMKERIYRGPRE